MPRSKQLRGHLPADRHHFDIAVLRTSTSEGGIWIHDNIAPGVSMDVSGPFNHFELELELELEPAGQYLFVAVELESRRSRR